ncbi:uncharacterized protein LOC143260475 [Megalopta genalis]|uniref:uncharacterized protein LOC143260475 n=1 Tax=Megalopta genalis TaxID=115081 RepID=UPI003FD5785D
MEKRSDMIETRSTTSEEIDDILDQTVVNSAKEKWKDASGETTDALTEGRIKKMKVVQLKRELMKLNIKPIGKKEELRNILIKQLQRNTAEKVSDSEEAESDVSAEDTYASSKGATRTARHKSKEWTRKQRATRGVKFTIKDVDVCLAYFTGDDRLPIEKWIADFEELSTLLEWNDVQMLLYAKRMLKGSAKQFVTYETGLTSWKILKKRLKHEFKTEVNSAIVHAQLAKRRRRRNESARQYIGALQEIASQGNVEDDALIEHIINGIQDEEMNKTMLYGACSLHEMRKRLELFDRRKEKMMKDKKPFIKKAEIEKKKIPHGKYDKAKGLKCFNCNNFGHIAPNYPEGKKSKQSGAKVNSIQCNDGELRVSIDNVTCCALVDTGKVRLNETSRTLTGFGNARIIPIERFDAKLVIGEDEHMTSILVVPQESMTSEVILGRDFLNRVELFINKGLITVKTAGDNKSESYTEHSETNKRDSNVDEDIIDLLSINFIEKDELSAYTSFDDKIQTDPIYSRPRRLSLKEKDVLSEQIKECLQSGVIHPSISEYTSPVVIVPKKNGEYRVCVDYRKINKQIVRDRFPMPLIEDSLDALAGARVFSVIDLRNGFFHVPVGKESQTYTSFVTPSGQYDFAKTPFGLCNSPAVFLRFIQEVFKHLIACKVVLTYMDDLIVPGVDNEDAFQKLVQTLKVAEENEYLGYEIEDGFVYPSPAKIKAVQYFPTPSSRKQIQSFLGLTGYFRKFIRDYGKIARPLSDLLKDNVKFSFSIEQLRSFEMLKAALANKPTLRIYNPTAITELHTDASKDGYGAILLQKDVDEKHFHPVYFMSRKTSDAERNYHSYELEILAVIKAVQKFRIYLLGIKFKLVTDCDALRKTLHKFDPSPKIARWALILEEFDYEVEHRPGSQLPHVDALSRYPVLIVEDTVLALVRKKQDEDERIRVIKQVLRTEPYENYVIENSVLMKEINNKKVIVLPASMVTEIIRKVHENGHFGIKKMTERIKDEYYIPNLEAKLEKFISCCVPCILAERKKGKAEGELTPIPKGDRPLSTYHIDHLGPMTSTSKAYKWYRMVDRVQRSINSTYQRSIGMSPFELMFGTKMRQAEDIRILDIIQQEVVDNFDNERSELRINAKKNLLKIQGENRRVYNKKPKFLGPYRVSGVRRNDRYEVIRVGGSEGSRITTTVVDCMKPYDVNSSENEEYAGMAECRTPRAR